MEEQLNLAPCGYLVMNQSFHVIEMNQTLRDMLGVEDSPVHLHDILTTPSRIYFQTYFAPSITVHGKVNELYLTLKAKEHQIPVLLNAVKQQDRYACVMVQMKVRDEYENELLMARRRAERVLHDTDEANKQLQELLKEVEEKQQELLDLNKDLLELALTDPLTGLKNRRYLQDKIMEFIELAKSSENEMFSLLLIDVDHFKEVNDTHGHPMGDAVLRELSWKLLRETRDNDIVARVGGEEFMILLPKMNEESARVIAERIRLNVDHGPWAQKRVTVSIGVTSYKFGDSPSSLYSKADQALYISKNAGRNRVSVS
ncbi:GGDEF domain-containing protein [Paenisporosarcina sp. NPDC076898]|uniref:GGDEF domain-containing protein n=1 Tax=unclassified Paenisporosarcina TaxID=2642018 RepID=UPI003D0603FA